jgi:hypothetical protein
MKGNRVDLMEMASSDKPTESGLYICWVSGILMESMYFVSENAKMIKRTDGAFYDFTDNSNPKLWLRVDANE